MTSHKAQLSYVRMTPRKVRAVADLMKGLSVNEAEAALLVRRNRATLPLLKLLRSAVANAKNNHRVAAEQLFVASIRVDTGPMLKRYLPRARGMATPIQKKMSHVTLVLEERPTVANPRFTIKIEKKTKVRGDEGRRPGKEKGKEGGERETTRAGREKSHPGFFRRVFSRKTASS